MTAGPDDVDDLFTRLAQRARHDTRPSIEAPFEPEPFIDTVAEIDVDSEPPPERPIAYDPDRDSGGLDHNGRSDAAPNATATPDRAPAPTAPIPPTVPPDPRGEETPARAVAHRRSPQPAADAEPRLAHTPTATHREDGRQPAPRIAAQLAHPAGDRLAGELVAAPASPLVVPRRAETATTPPPQPIEVTIGRVEIRVHPPAAPTGERSRRKAAPAAPLSLDEYLRRREAST